MVFGILGDQDGGIIVWAYTFQKKSVVRKRRNFWVWFFIFLKLKKKIDFQIFFCKRSEKFFLLK